MTNAQICERIRHWRNALSYYEDSREWREDVRVAGLDGLPEDPGLMAEAIRADMLTVLRELAAHIPEEP